jgi:hypothetical protein
MKREIIYAPLVGRRLQKIEKDQNGVLYFHFACGIVQAGPICIANPEGHWYTARKPIPEPLVIPA